MTSYAPVAVSGSIAQGQPAGDNFNGNGGVRREWWWRAGPVDSCCCCCSLRTGVGLLAVDSLLSGLWFLFVMRAFYAATLESSLEILNDQYSGTCAGVVPASPQDCEQLKVAIAQVEGGIDLFRHFPTVIYVQGVFSLVAGVVGLWAVFLRSQRAAKVFMLTWPVKFLLAVVGTIQLQSLSNKYGVEQHYQGIVWLLSGFFLLYYFKVSWSYYKKRLDYDNDCSRSSNSRAAAPDTVYRWRPMPAINTNV